METNYEEGCFNSGNSDDVCNGFRRDDTKSQNDV